MEERNKKIIIFVAIAIGIIILAVGGFFARKKYFKPKPILPAPKAEEQKKVEVPTSLGEQIYNQTQNPAEKIPQTNPYKTQTNPFEQTKTNPYQNIYINPFK